MTLRVVHLAFYERTYFLFWVPFSRPLLKNKLRLRKGRMTYDHYLSVSSLLKTTQTLPGKKCYLFKKRGVYGGVVFGKCGRSRASIALMASRTFLFPNHFCVHGTGRECWDADLDVHARCFLSASYGFIPLVLDDWKQRRERRPVGLRGQGFRWLKSCFSFAL